MADEARSLKAYQELPENSESLEKRADIILFYILGPI